MHPMVMAVAGLPDADSRSLNEVFGFFVRLAIQAGGNMTDYVIDAGTAWAIGGQNTERLLELAIDAGLIIRTDSSNKFQLVQDEELVHMRLKEEIAWERQRKRDTYANNPDVLAVRFRDGDQCRWCGILCQPLGQRSNRSLTIDHLNPGVPGTVESMIVACQSCNSSRKADVERWGENHKLRPISPTPKYGRATARLLSNNGYKVTPNIGVDAEKDPGMLPIQAALESESVSSSRSSSLESSSASGQARLSSSEAEARSSSHKRDEDRSSSRSPASELSSASGQARLSSSASEVRSSSRSSPIEVNAPPGQVDKHPLYTHKDTEKYLDVKVFGTGEDYPKISLPGTGRDGTSGREGKGRSLGGVGSESGQAGLVSVREGSGSGQVGVGSVRRRSGRSRRRKDSRG